MFLQNCWYMAAWSNEIGRVLLERQICNESIVLYRSESGDPVALGNVCPHRFAPLSVGKLIGDEIQCGYHGFRFGTSGACTKSPLIDGIIPARMRVKRYAVIERYGMVWLWLGDAEASDASIIPDFSCNDDPAFRRIQGMMEVAANYELITDNLLDLTHAEFVHEGILDSVALTRSKLETIQKGTTVWSNRWAPNGDAPPAWAAAFDNYDQPVDHWAYMRWDPPGNLLLDVGVTRPGQKRSDGVWLYGCDMLTPRDATSSWYFWSFARSYKLDDAATDDMWRGAIDIAFVGQDKPILEQQQRMMGTRTIDEMNPVMASADVAATRARRIMKMLIAKEAEGAMPEPGGQPPLELLKRKADTRLPVEPVV
jgi:phenylpropionate dioxygenase-like ring-hydroxylating dioxygenase large terminal subunit